MKIFYSLLIAILVLAGTAVAQGFSQPEATVPDFVASHDSATSNYLPLYDHTMDSLDDATLSMIQVSAVTDATYNFWKYFPSSSTWSFLAPLKGATLADSTISLSAGQSETYYFQGTLPTSMGVWTGSITVKAE